LEGLLPAFDELRSIRLYKQAAPELNRKKHYENFARVLCTVQGPLVEGR